MQLGICEREREPSHLDRVPERRPGAASLDVGNRSWIDAGGLQAESTYFRTPCRTLRPNTERPVTVTHGSNKLTNLQSLSADIDEALSGGVKHDRVPPLWDGRAAERLPRLES